MCADKDRILLDHEVYDGRGSMIQSLMIQLNCNTKLKDNYLDGFYSGIG